MTDTKAVEIEGTIKRLRTMADGSIDLTISLPEYCIPAVAVMLGWHDKLVGGVLELKSLTEFDDEAKKDTEGSGPKVDRRRIRKRRNK